MSARAVGTLWREAGLVGCARKLRAALGMSVPVLLRGRRTGPGVGAYFDLITDESRRFYGDSFHFGYFASGRETLAEALDAHTDLVAGLARVAPGHHVLDVGCGIGAPALRIAERHDCLITGVNISREQVRQGRLLVAAERMGERVRLHRADARALRYADASFDAVLCLEVAGDICVTEADKDRLVAELHRVLRPGGHVGFSDLALRTLPPPEDERTLRTILYHAGAELLTDWPAVFARNGFTVLEHRCILDHTLATWQRTRAVYEARDGEVARRYGERVAGRIRPHVDRIPGILARHGTFPVLSARRDA